MTNYCNDTGAFCSTEAEVIVRAKGVLLFVTAGLALAGPGCSGAWAGGTTFTTTTADTLTVNPATVTLRQSDVFTTEIIGQLAGGATVFDQIVPVRFTNPAAQAAVASADAALLAAGGPGLSLTGPTLQSHTETVLNSSSVTLYSLASANFQVLATTDTVGPAVITVGDVNVCAAAVAGLPSATPPGACVTNPQTFTVVAGNINIDVRSGTAYVVDQTVTTTQTVGISEVYRILGGTAVAMPEPASAALLGPGLALLLARGRRRRPG